MIRSMAAQKGAASLQSGCPHTKRMQKRSSGMAPDAIPLADVVLAGARAIAPPRALRGRSWRGLGRRSCGECEGEHLIHVIVRNQHIHNAIAIKVVHQHISRRTSWWGHLPWLIHETLAVHRHQVPSIKRAIASNDNVLGTSGGSNLRIECDWEAWCSDPCVSKDGLENVSGEHMLCVRSVLQVVPWHLVREDARLVFLVGMVRREEIQNAISVEVDRLHGEALEAIPIDFARPLVLTSLCEAVHHQFASAVPEMRAERCQPILVIYGVADHIGAIHDFVLLPLLRHHLVRAGIPVPHELAPKARDRKGGDGTGAEDIEMPIAIHVAPLDLVVEMPFQLRSDTMQVSTLVEENVAIRLGRHQKAIGNYQHVTLASSDRWRGVIELVRPQDFVRDLLLDV